MELMQSDNLRDLMERANKKIEQEIEATVTQRDALDEKIDDLRKSLSGTRAALKKLR